MKRRFPLLLVLLASCSFFISCAGPAPRPEGDGPAGLHYRIRPDRGSGTVAVTAFITGLDQSGDLLRIWFERGHTFLKLDEPLLAGPVRAFGSEGALPVEQIDSFKWEVDLAGERDVRLEYVVPMRHRSLEVVRESHDAYEFPYLAGDHGMLTTWTLFAIPHSIGPVRPVVTFENCEDGAIVPWPRIGPATYEPPSFRALTNDLIALGNWSSSTIEVGEFEGIVAIAPGQPDLERAAFETIRKIVEAELALFGRPPSGRYLFLFGRPDISGAGGSPKANSMTLAVEPRLAARGADFLAHLVAHEFHHTWTASLFDVPDEMRWYNEGFTDYFAYLVIARLGLTTWEEFSTTLGGKMAECASSKHRGKLSLAEAGGDVFFSDRDAYNLVYAGGLLTAAWLDCAIRSAGQGKRLDDLMREFNNDKRWQDPPFGHPTVDDFVAAAETFIGKERAAELEAMVREPFEVDPTAAFRPVGVTVTHSSKAPTRNLRANLDGTRVIDLDPKGAAWQLGIRGGDRILAVNGDDVPGQIELRVAWGRAMAGERVRISLERDGARREIDEPVPRIETYNVPIDSWREQS